MGQRQPTIPWAWKCSAWWPASGFVLSFGYWCTDFLVVQRAMAADSMSAARRTPLIGAIPEDVLAVHRDPARHRRGGADAKMNVGYYAAARRRRRSRITTR